MKILILTSGGDAPGMNRFIWEIYKKFKNQVYFAYAGFSGLLDEQIFPLSEVISKEDKDRPGACVKSSRCPEFKRARFFKKGLEVAKKFDAVIILGGNGSEKGAKQLFSNGVNTIFVPGTIDNDVDDSSYSIGFSTAVNEAVYAVENSMSSIKTMGNACLFEVMGREDSSICEAVEERTKADYAVTDKKSLDFEKMKNIILKKQVENDSACIIVRENIMPVSEIASKLNELLGADVVKTHIVGRTQRGGKPTKFELQMATKFAKETIRCIKTRVLGVRVLSDENYNMKVMEFKG